MQYETSQTQPSCVIRLAGGQVPREKPGCRPCPIGLAQSTRGKQAEASDHAEGQGKQS